MFSIFDKDHLQLARRAATEGIVLLRNENGTLPLSKSKPVALLGRTQFDVFKGGGGSSSVWSAPVYSFADAMNETGTVYQPLLKKYRGYYEANYNRTLNKMPSQRVSSLPEVDLGERDMQAAAAECDTAVIFIGRYSREGFDIKDASGEYRLTDTEERVIGRATACFQKTVLVFNIPSLFDLTFLRKYHIDAIVHAYMPGMDAGHALADVLYGDVTPSGKMPDSFAESLSNYPTADGFDEMNVVYREGIYMGYRYFDTFRQDVIFPFGFGLSYTTFAIKVLSATLQKLTVSLAIEVTNTGSVAGKETVQCYLSAPDGELDKPYQILCGFEKTKLLSDGESQRIVIDVDLSDFTSYSEKRAAYILEAGKYVLRIGNHSRGTVPACVAVLDKTVVCKQVKNRLMPEAPIAELQKEGGKSEEIKDVPILTVDTDSVVTEIAPDLLPAQETVAAKSCSFEDVVCNKSTALEFVAQLTDDELALFLTADSSAKMRGLGLTPRSMAIGEGSHTHPDKERGIPSTVMQDGPAGVRAGLLFIPIPPDEEINGRDCICYPCATLLAATWNRELMREIGYAITKDMTRVGFNGLCAPGVNLHRNPLCGRNFEYLSEDPFLAAELAASEIMGIQNGLDGTPTKKYAILKHFACNNSEKNRMEGSSNLSERCARELYLRVFEYTIRKSNPLSIMTAYNRINGIFAAANSDLNDGICRTEWGYEGWIMTDWNVHASAAECINGGSDTVMPGAYVTAEEFAAQGVTRATAQRRVASLIRHLAKTEHYT